MLIMRLMAQPLVMLIAFAFAVEATEAVGQFVMAVTLPAMNEAITSTMLGWAGRLTILTAAILVVTFTIWEIVMGFTNQIFKWVGDVANDLGESKANQAFVGVASTAKGSTGQLAQASAMQGKPPPKDKPNPDDKKEGTQVDGGENR